MNTTPENIVSAAQITDELIAEMALQCSRIASNRFGEAPGHWVATCWMALSRHARRWDPAKSGFRHWCWICCHRRCEEQLCRDKDMMRSSKEKRWLSRRPVNYRPREVVHENPTRAIEVEEKMTKLRNRLGEDLQELMNLHSRSYTVQSHADGRPVGTVKSVANRVRVRAREILEAYDQV